MAPKSRVKFFNGPWPEGLNTKDTVRLLKDTELSTLLNLDVNNDGTLSPRDNLRVVKSNTTFDPVNPADLEEGIVFSGTGNLKPLGTVINNNNSNNTIILDGTALKNYIFNSGLSETLPFTGVVLDSGYVQTIEYNDFVYFINVTVSKCFRISSTAATVGGAVTLIPTFPDCDFNSRALILKDRLFVFSGNRVYYSKVTDPTVWAAPDGGFFDVNPDTGNSITDFAVVNDVLYIFKAYQVWSFSFSSDPGVDGSLNIISSDKGASSICVYQNNIYCIDAVSLYLFTNGQFTDLATKLNFTGGGESALFVLKNRLYVGLSFSLNLINGAWSEYSLAVWQSSTLEDRYNIVVQAGQNIAIIGGSALYVLGNPNETYDSFVHYDGTVKQILPDFQFKTKSFNFGDPFKWKRLFKTYLDFDSTMRGSFTLESYYDTLDDIDIDALYAGREPSNKGSFYFSKNMSHRLKALTVSVRFKEIVLGYSASDRINGLFYTYQYRGSEGSSSNDIPHIRQIALDLALKTDADR